MLVGGMLEVEKENWAVQRINLKSGLKEDKEYQQKGVEGNRNYHSDSVKCASWTCSVDEGGPCGTKSWEGIRHKE